jgi:hypothetical protein
LIRRGPLGPAATPIQRRNSGMGVSTYTVTGDFATRADSSS